MTHAQAMPHDKPTIVGRLVAAPEAGVAIAIIAACAVFAAVNPSFVEPSNLRSMVRAMAFVGIVAVGLGLLLIAGELDISVGSVAGLGAVTVATLGRADWPTLAAVAGGLGVGATVGLINGSLAVLVGLPPFIVTLGMLFAARGIALIVANGRTIYPLPAGLETFGAARPLLELPWSVWIFILVLIAAELLLRFGVVGRRLYAAGGNRRAARVAGVRTTRLKIGTYVLTGVLASLAGILLMMDFGRGDPQIGLRWELNAIAAAVIGGVSLFGGVGSVTGVALGLLFLQVLTTGLIVAGASSSLQPVAVGLVMVLAVALDRARVRRRG